MTIDSAACGLLKSLTSGVCGLVWVRLESLGELDDAVAIEEFMDEFISSDSRELASIESAGSAPCRTVGCCIRRAAPGVPAPCEFRKSGVDVCTDPSRVGVSGSSSGMWHMLKRCSRSTGCPEVGLPLGDPPGDSWGDPHAMGRGNRGDELCKGTVSSFSLSAWRILREEHDSHSSCASSQSIPGMALRTPWKGEHVQYLDPSMESCESVERLQGVSGTRGLGDCGALRLDCRPAGKNAVWTGFAQRKDSSGVRSPFELLPKLSKLESALIGRGLRSEFVKWSRFWPEEEVSVSTKEALDRERKLPCFWDFVLLKGCGRLSESVFAHGREFWRDVSGVKMPGMAKTLLPHVGVVDIGDIEATEAIEAV